MRVVLVRSGGFGGTRRTLRLAPPALDDDGASLLRAAAERACFFALPARLEAPRPRADAFRYRLELEDGDRAHAVDFDEAAADPALRALVEAVEAAGDAPP